MLLILIGLVAAAGAAPRIPFSDETSLGNAMPMPMQHGNMATPEQRIPQMSLNLPQVVREEGVVGGESKIEITGIPESDISVKSRPGLVNVVAKHNIGLGSTNFTWSLPDSVGANNHWTYEDGILKIVFP